jgi:hypothetical protein
MRNLRCALGGGGGGRGGLRNRAIITDEFEFCLAHVTLRHDMNLLNRIRVHNWDWDFFRSRQLGQM